MTKLSGAMLPPKSGRAARQLFVLLHGYGADGNDLIALGWQWRDLFPDAHFFAPNAPETCAVNPGGYQWFPLDVERIGARIDGLDIARPVIDAFLADLWAQSGLGPADTVLGGFSQGAMLALHAGTAMASPLAAIVSFSGAFVPPPGFEAGRFARPPVALIHGELDEVVPTGLSRDAATLLAESGFDASLHISPGLGHGIAPDGLEFATAFLTTHVG